MSDWHDVEREMVANSLLIEFPELSIDKLLAAVRECDAEVKREEGRANLLKCTRAHLVKMQGTGEKHLGARAHKRGSNMK